MPHILQHHAKASRPDPVLLEGPPLPALLLFALPIVMGNIFQQLYNVIDAIVIGKFLGNLPLAGISVASPILDVINAIIIGGSIGVGVLAANIFGAGDMPRLKRNHSTALLAGLAISLLLAAGSAALAGAVLRSQGTEEAVCREALRYLYIVLAGMPFCFLYNYYASMLRSCGDSRMPFLILLVSSLLHAGLDFLLVAVFGLGIGGIACSTVFCQLFSAAWCILYAKGNYPPLALGRGDMHFSLRVCRQLLSYAWAAALQQAVVCIGRLLVQGTLSSLGTDTVTGYNMGMRSEAFLFCFSQGMSAALAVCVSQSMGHGDRGRMRRFYLCAMGASLALSVVLAGLYRLWAHGLIAMFSDSPAVIAAGAEYLGTMALFYIMAYLCEMTQGFFRGLGRMRLTMIFSLAQIVLRVGLSFLLVPSYGIGGICAAVIAGWVLQLLVEVSYGLYTAHRLRA